MQLFIKKNFWVSLIIGVTAAANPKYDRVYCCIMLRDAFRVIWRESHYAAYFMCCFFFVSVDHPLLNFFLADHVPHNFIFLAPHVPHNFFPPPHHVPHNFNKSFRSPPRTFLNGIALSDNHPINIIVLIHR